MLFRSTINHRPSVWACDDPLDHVGGSCVTNVRKETLLTAATDAQGRLDEAAFARSLGAETCTVCRLFGSPWLASKIRIKDLSLQEDSWTGRVETRTGVGIDRDTHTASPKALYSFEVVPPEALFDFEVVIENADEVELGLLVMGLRELEAGRVTLGSAGSRGLGWCKLLDLKCAEWVDAANLLTYLAGGKMEAPPKALDDYIQSVSQAILGGGE